MHGILLIALRRSALDRRLRTAPPRTAAAQAPRFDGFDGVLPGLEDVSHLPALTAGLVARGYSDEKVAQILGGNYLRVFRQVAG